MEDVRGKYVSPAVDQLAFNCPHCGALTKQFWFRVHLSQLGKNACPTVLTADELKELTLDKVKEEDREKVQKWAKRMASGRPFIEETDNSFIKYDVWNVSISRCFNCEDMCVWLYDKLLWPQPHGGPQPNIDLSADVRRDYDEASAILDVSPRGAAALLRLAIQKLCKELGEDGKDINDDIASLVKKGLDARLQKALDVVRVVGNHAVHPGKIDLRDDRSTAEILTARRNPTLLCVLCVLCVSAVQHLFLSLKINP